MTHINLLRLVCLLISFLSFNTFAIPPTISVVRYPSPLLAGQAYGVYWTTTNATSVSYNCTSTGTGFVGTGTLPVNGSNFDNAPISWRGFPSHCVWTAIGMDGTATYFEDIITVAPKPTFVVTRYPNPMVVGKPYNLSFLATNAKSISYDCKSSGTGYVGSGQFNQMSFNKDAAPPDPSWVGHPSDCVWTVIGIGEDVVTVNEKLVTVVDPVKVGDVVGRDLLVTGLGAFGHVGMWDGSRVIEVLNEPTVLQSNTLDNFKVRSVYWGASSANITPYNVVNCFRINCSPQTLEVVDVRLAMIRRAYQIQLLGADYTLSWVSTPAYPSEQGSPVTRGSYRCDTFVYDLMAATTYKRNKYQHFYPNTPADPKWEANLILIDDLLYKRLLLPAVLFRLMNYK